MASISQATRRTICVSTNSCFHLGRVPKHYFSVVLIPNDQGIQINFWPARVIFVELLYGLAQLCLELFAL
jgi:hypothetical protein